MSSVKTKSKHEALALLKKDHAVVKKLFDRFEKTEKLSEKKTIVSEACAELKVHAEMEERIFYPALRQQMEDPDGLIDEADEEHHEAKFLIAELELMRGDEENYCAKFEVLGENVRHHIKEEEGKLFAQAKKTAIDFDALGEQMHELKLRLLAEGVEPGDEALMVNANGVAKLSPSRMAQANFAPPLKEKKRARKH